MDDAVLAVSVAAGEGDWFLEEVLANGAGEGASAGGEVGGQLALHLAIIVYRDGVVIQEAKKLF